MLKLPKTTWLIGSLAVFFLFGAFFFYYWWETKESLVAQIKANENLIKQIGKYREEVIKLQQELTREIGENENLMKKLEELESEIKKLNQEIKKLKNPNLKKIIHLPILLYHHIDFLPPDASQLKRALTVSPEIFEVQMKYLSEKNYRPITFEEFFSFLESGEEIPERSLIITFDDGWKNQYQYAFPILKKYGFRATFFVVVNQIGGPRLMNWEELKELLENGMEIGSHSLSHPNLLDLAEPTLLSEIRDSKIILERNLGQKIKVFAYPYGAFNERIIEVVKESNYLAGRTTILGTYQNLENLYTLKAIQVSDSLDQFSRLFPAEGIIH